MSREAERVVRSESGILDLGGRGQAVIFGAGNWGGGVKRAIFSVWTKLLLQAV
jgi:hypothetical protein